MRFRSLALLGAVSVGTVVACGDTDTPDASSPDNSCEDALARLDDCVAQHCESNEDAICPVLLSKQSNSLFAPADVSCESMSVADIERLNTASCEALIQDAKLLAAGKADFPCPSYFPWCNELTTDNAFFHVNVLSSDASGTSLEVLVGEVSQTTTMKDGKAYQKLSLQGASSTGEVGRPDVPTISFLVGLPSTVDTVAIESVEREDRWDVEDILLLPHMESQVEDDPDATFMIDEAAYQQDAAYPALDYQLDEVSIWRNYRVVRVTVHPFQYNSLHQTLSATRRLTLRLAFSDTGTMPDEPVEAGEAGNAGAYSNALVNYPETAGDDETEEDPTRIRYLIIAHDPLVEAVQPLVELKQQQGLPTQVVKLSEVGADPAKIKERIAQAYDESAIEYVLLVGEVEDLPMYIYELPWTSFYPDGDLPGDYWYSLLAGDDLLPEVSVGRMTGSAEEVALHVAKTVAYETGNISDAWRKKVMLVADDDQYPSKYTACCEDVRTREYAAGNVDFVTMYGGEHPTEQALVDQINAGVGILAYRGHGLEDAWLEWNGEDFRAGNAELDNGAMTPVVFSIACFEHGDAGGANFPRGAVGASSRRRRSGILGGNQAFMDAAQRPVHEAAVPRPVR